VYSDPVGNLMLVGPKSGWSCRGSYGADGSGMLALTPLGISVPADASNTWHLPATSQVQAIVAMESGASTVQGAALACPLFAAAATATQQGLGNACAGTSPSRETKVTDSPVEVAFQDPAGVPGVGFPSGGTYPANGIMLYQPKANEASAYLATCTLPSAQHDLCTAVLNHFVSQYG
jgi:hypothetical protein